MSSMRDGLDSPIGRRTPAKGVFPTADGATILFVTVCAADRSASWCASDDVLAILAEIWSDSKMRWLVGDFLLMPDHLHFFCTPASGKFVEVERWASFWKHVFAKRWGVRDAWQRGLFHHRLRSEREYQDKVTYMLNNPVRAALVQTADEWRWRGRVNEVRW